MKTLIKLIFGLVGLVIVVVLAVAAALATLDPNDYKDWIAGKAEEQTGRTLTLGGDIDLTYYPWLGLQASDITVGNAPGFGDQPFFHTDSIKLRVKLIPLLQNKYEVDTIYIKGAVINLQKNRAGVTNWADLAGEPREQGEPVALTAFVLGGVDISDTSLTWDDQSTGTRYDISSVNISTNELVYGEPIDLSLSLNAVANKPEVTAQAGLTGTINYDLDKETVVIRPLRFTSTIRGKNIPGGETQMILSAAIDVSLADDTARISGLNFDVLGTRVAGSINAGRIQTPAPSVTADINVEGTDLALLFKVLEIEPLAAQLAGLNNRQFNLTMVVDADMDRGDVDVSRFSANVLDANIRGAVKARNIKSDAPTVQGSIQAAGQDLPTLLQVAGQFEGGEEPKLAHYGEQLAGIPDRQKKFSTNIEFDADIKSGDIDVSALSIKALGITVAGDLKARDMQDKAGTVNGKLSVIGQGLPQLLTALGQKSLAEVLQSFIFEVGVSGDRRNLHLQPMSLKALFSGKQIPNSPVNVSLNADTNINIDAQRLALANFTVRGMGLNVRGDLDAANILEAPEFQGQVSIDAFNLRQLLTQLNQEIPVTADKKVLRKVAVKTDFDGSRQHMNLSQLGLVLDDTSLTGNLSVSDFDSPAVQFGIDIDTINVDRYLPPVEPGKPVKPVTPEAAAGAAAQLPVEMLRALNVKGELKIGSLIISKARMTNVRLSLQGKDGLIRLDPVAADLYQGKYTGNINLDATGRLPRITINSALKQVQIEPLMTDVMGEGKMRGRGDFSAALIAAGADIGTMKKTLNGQMSFSFRDGAIKGYNLGKIMRMGNQLQDNFSLKVSKKEETDFAEISGNPVVTNGIVTLDDLAGKSPAVRLSGNGILADLPNNSMDYQITAQLVATSKGQGGKELQAGKLEGVPLDCYLKGSLDNLKRDCDATKLIAALGMKVIQGLMNLSGKAAPGEGQTDTVEGAQAAPPTGSGQEIDATLKQAEDVLKGLFGQ